MDVRWKCGIKACLISRYHPIDYPEEEGDKIMKKFIFAALLVSMLAMALTVPAFAEQAKDTCVASRPCSDDDISAYRWQAMAKYYVG